MAQNTRQTIDYSTGTMPPPPPHTEDVGC